MAIFDILQVEGHNNNTTNVFLYLRFLAYYKHI